MKKQIYKIGRKYKIIECGIYSEHNGKTGILKAIDPELHYSYTISNKEFFCQAKSIAPIIPKKVKQKTSYKSIDLRRDENGWSFGHILVRDDDDDVDDDYIIPVIPSWTSPVCLMEGLVFVDPNSFCFAPKKTTIAA